MKTHERGKQPDFTELSLAVSKLLAIELMWWWDGEVEKGLPRIGMVLDCSLR